MVIGAHRPKQACNTDLRASITIGLDEALTALEESISGLTDEQFWAFPIEHRYNIVTLVEHSIQCLDLYACEIQGAHLTFEPEERFDIWHFSPEQVRPKMKDLPTVEAERERIAQLRCAVTDVLDGMPDDDLRKSPQNWWSEDHSGRTRADAYMRCIWHTMGHVRQIWFLRGLLRLSDNQGWPHQHWA